MDLIMKSREMRFSIFTFFSFILVLAYTSTCVGEVLFEDDFEGGTVDKKKWNPAETWVVDKGALGANGGEIGITVKNDFTDFEFHTDFNMVAPLFAPNFVLRAKDKDNCTLVQLVADARNQFWWFTKVGGKYIVDKKNFQANESGVKPELGKWYSIKLVAEGNRYEIHLAEQGKELKLACKWEDKTHNKGGIGFREGAGEHCKYDNVVVTTIGHSFDNATPVNKNDKLPTMWGNIKRSY